MGRVTLNQFSIRKMADWFDLDFVGARYLSSVIFQFYVEKL